MVGLTCRANKLFVKSIGHQRLRKAPSKREWEKDRRVWWGWGGWRSESWSERGETEIAGALFYRVCTQQWLMWPGQGMELDGARIEITKFIWRYFHTAAGLWPKVLSLRGNWGDWPCFFPGGQTQSKRQDTAMLNMVYYSITIWICHISLNGVWRSLNVVVCTVWLIWGLNYTVPQPTAHYTKLILRKGQSLKIGSSQHNSSPFTRSFTSWSEYM